MSTAKYTYWKEVQAKAFRETLAKLLKERKSDSTPAPAKIEDASVARFIEEIKVYLGTCPSGSSVKPGRFEFLGADGDYDFIQE